MREHKGKFTLPVVMNVHVNKVDVMGCPITTEGAGRILPVPGKVERCAEPRMCLVYCSHSAIMEYLSGLLARITSSLLDVVLL